MRLRASQVPFLAVAGEDLGTWETPFFTDHSKDAGLPSTHVLTSYEARERGYLGSSYHTSLEARLRASQGRRFSPINGQNRGSGDAREPRARKELLSSEPFAQILSIFCSFLSGFAHEAWAHFVLGHRVLGQSISDTVQWHYAGTVLLVEAHGGLCPN